MVEAIAQQLGFIVSEKISERECTVIDRSGINAKTLTVLEDNEFTKNIIDKLKSTHLSYLCRIDDVQSMNGKLIILSSDVGEISDNPSALAACCGAMVLKECGASHSSLLSSVRQVGRQYKLFGIDKIVPYSPENEQAQVKTLAEMCRITTQSSFEKLRECLSMYANRRDTAERRRNAGEDAKNKLLALPEFKREWQSLEYINAGAYGFIYKAVSAFDGKTYALKVMSVGNDNEKIWRAKRESTNASQFLGSDYIVKTYDDGKAVTDDGKYIWICMELLEPIPNEISDERTVAMIARDVCCALEEVHKDGGMAHRDVKPGNILKGENNWKLCDFGITKEVQGRDMATVIGTSEFMAPELLAAAINSADKTSYNNTVDIYALGITMYTLLNCGTPPFLPTPPYLPTAAEQKEAKLRRISGDEFPKAANCSDELMSIIKRACAHKAEQRFKTASQMREVLDDYLD